MGEGAKRLWPRLLVLGRSELRGRVGEKLAQRRSLSDSVVTKAHEVKGQRR